MPSNAAWSAGGKLGVLQSPHIVSPVGPGCGAGGTAMNVKWMNEVPQTRAGDV